MAEELGISLDGAKAVHEVFSRHGWEIVIDFEKDDLPDRVWVNDFRLPILRPCSGQVFE